MPAGKYDMTEQEVMSYIKSNKVPVSIGTSPLHGDSGMWMIACYYDATASKWVVEHPIDRSNLVSREEYDTESDAWKSVYFSVKRV